MIKLKEALFPSKNKKKPSAKLLEAVTLFKREGESNTDLNIVGLNKIFSYVFDNKLKYIDDPNRDEPFKGYFKDAKGNIYTLDFK